MFYGSSEPQVRCTSVKLAYKHKFGKYLYFTDLLNKYDVCRSSDNSQEIMVNYSSVYSKDTISRIHVLDLLASTIQ